MDEEDTSDVHHGNISMTKSSHSPRNFMTSSPKHSSERNLIHGNDVRSTVPVDSTQVQEILHSLPRMCQFLQEQCEMSGFKPEGFGYEQQTQEHVKNESNPMRSFGEKSRNFSPKCRLDDASFHDSPGRLPVNMLHTQTQQYQPIPNSNQTPHKAEQKTQKEKKSITTKTFAKGMMDVSLLTSNATQLRSVMSTPDHDFYTLLLWLISLSVTLQILSSVLLIMSDFFKTQVKETDRQNQRKRKILNFLSLALITIVTSLNVLISAFYSPGTVSHRQSNVPQFSQASLMSNKHTDL